MRRFMICVVLVLFTGLPQQVFADLAYVNRTDFENAVQSNLTLTTIDFEQLGTGKFISFSLPDGPGFQSNPPLTPDSGLTEDLEIGSGFTQAPTHFLIGHAGAIYSHLPGGTFAVGAEVGGKPPTSALSPTFTFQAYDWSFNIIASVDVIPNDTISTFVGFVSTSDIRMVYLTSNTSDTLVTLDNFTYAHTVSAVPEPTSIVFGSVTIVVASMFRRQAKELQKV